MSGPNLARGLGRRHPLLLSSPRPIRHWPPRCPLRILPLLLLLVGCATAPLKSEGQQRTTSTVLASTPPSPGGEECVTLHCWEDGTCFLVASAAEEGGAHTPEADAWEGASPSVLHRGALTARPLPNPTLTPQRNWGAPQALPQDSQPVFEIPWGSHDRSASLELAEKLCGWPPGKYVRHHIFPQEAELAKWFDERGIDIHAHTLLTPSSEHRRVHSGGPCGGAWNESWRVFKREYPRATQEQIWLHAMQLIIDFNLKSGQLVPYRSPRCRELPLPKAPEAPLCDCTP